MYSVVLQDFIKSSELLFFAHLLSHLRIHNYNIQSKQFLPWHLMLRSPKSRFSHTAVKYLHSVNSAMKDPKVLNFHQSWVTQITIKKSVKSAYSGKFIVKNYSNLKQNSESDQSASFYVQKLKEICKEIKIKSFHCKTFIKSGYKSSVKEFLFEHYLIHFKFPLVLIFLPNEIKRPHKKLHIFVCII